MMFSCDEHQGGWLRYKPFGQYALPEIVSLDETVRLKPPERHGGSPVEPDPERRLYYLHWPGAGTPHADPYGCEVPMHLVDQWIVDYGLVAHAKVPRTVRLLVQDRVLPPVVPIPLAYHVAVNSRRVQYTGSGKVEWVDGLPAMPVAGLTAAGASFVVGQSFALDGEDLAAIRYLKWLAEGHRHHPLFNRFDTSIHEELMGLSVKAAKLFFMLLGDCIFDPDEQFFSRDPRRYGWNRLACYLHFAGRVGTGRIFDQSGMDTWNKQNEKDFPGIWFAMDEWDGKAEREASRLRAVGEPRRRSRR
jgi:hypothetical protein